MVAGIIKLLRSGLQSKLDFKNSEIFSGSDDIKAFFFGFPGVLDFSGGNLVGFVKIRDAVGQAG